MDQPDNQVVTSIVKPPPVWNRRKLSVTGALKVHRAEISVINGITRPVLEVIDDLGTIYDASYPWTLNEAHNQVVKWPDGIYGRYELRYSVESMASGIFHTSRWGVYANSFEDAKSFLLNEKKWLSVTAKIELESITEPTEGIALGAVFEHRY